MVDVQAVAWRVFPRALHWGREAAETKRFHQEAWVAAGRPEPKRRRRTQGDRLRDQNPWLD